MSKTQREWITPTAAPLQRSYGVVAVSQKYQNLKKNRRRLRYRGLCLISMSSMYFFLVYSGYSTFYCGFESHQGSMCNFKVESDSGTSYPLIWNRETGRPSSSTGPNMDHTYETSTGIIRLTKYKFSYTDVEKRKGWSCSPFLFFTFSFSLLFTCKFS